MTGHPDLRGRVGGLIARGAAPEKIEAARVGLKAANLREQIREAVATWPPLSAETRAELAVLLLDSGAGSDAT